MQTINASDKQVTAKVYGARGEGQVYASLRTAVLHHNQLRDESGMGGRDWRPWTVECEGEKYYISYNGRVWADSPKKWSPETVEVMVDLS